MATITRNGKTKPVKNLRWLVSHGKHVVAVRIGPPTDPANEASMNATLADGTVYATDWGCKRLCWDWIRTRSSLFGAELYWFGTRYDVAVMPKTMPAEANYAENQKKK